MLKTPQTTVKSDQSDGHISRDPGRSSGKTIKFRDEKKRKAFLKLLEAARTLFGIFPVKYIHRFDCKKKSEGIRNVGLVDQFGQSWGLSPNSGGITLWSMSGD